MMMMMKTTKRWTALEPMCYIINIPQFEAKLRQMPISQPLEFGLNVALSKLR